MAKVKENSVLFVSILFEINLNGILRWESSSLLIQNIFLFGPSGKQFIALLTGRSTYRLTDVAKTDMKMSQLGLRN